MSTRSVAIPENTYVLIREVLQNEFRYDFRKGPREISAGTVVTVLKTMMHVNTVNTVPGRNVTRTFPKIVQKFVLQNLPINGVFTVVQSGAVKLVL